MHHKNAPQSNMWGGNSHDIGKSKRFKCLVSIYTKITNHVYNLKAPSLFIQYFLWNDSIFYFIHIRSGFAIFYLRQTILVFVSRFLRRVLLINVFILVKHDFQISLSICWLLSNMVGSSAYRILYCYKFRYLFSIDMVKFYLHIMLCRMISIYSTGFIKVL